MAYLFRWSTELHRYIYVHAWKCVYVCECAYVSESVRASVWVRKWCVCVSKWVCEWVYVSECVRARVCMCEWVRVCVLLVKFMPLIIIMGSNCFLFSQFLSCILFVILDRKELEAIQIICNIFSQLYRHSWVSHIFKMAPWWTHRSYVSSSL